MQPCRKRHSSTLPFGAQHLVSQNGSTTTTQRRQLYSKTIASGSTLGTRPPQKTSKMKQARLTFRLFVAARITLLRLRPVWDRSSAPLLLFDQQRKLHPCSVAPQVTLYDVQERRVVCALCREIRGRLARKAGEMKDCVVAQGNVGTSILQRGYVDDKSGAAYASRQISGGGRIQYRSSAKCSIHFTLLYSYL
jgi:hypothetical protein